MSSKYSDNLPLHKAIENADIEAVKLLISSGADVNRKDSQGYTPVHLAILLKNIETLNFLLSACADVVDLNAKDSGGRTTFDLAIQTNNLEVVEIFLKVQHKTEKNNIKALFFSVRNNHASLLKSLLSLKVVTANGNSDDNICGLTPLHEACAVNQGQSHLSVIEILLKNGADVNARDIFGRTPFYCLTGTANKKMVELVLKYEPDVNAKDSEGKISLNEALLHKNYEIFELLVDDYAADVKNIDAAGFTLLHEACTFGDEKFIKFILNNKEGSKILSTENADKIDKVTPFDCILAYLYSDERRDKTRRILKFLTKYMDVGKEKNFITSPRLSESWKVLLEHFAELQALYLYFNPSVLEVISNCEELREYFNKCTCELEAAKNTKIQDCWVTFFNLLVDGKRKLKNYAGNQDLVDNYKKIGCFEKFPIYGSRIGNNLFKGIKRRNLFDASVTLLSDALPIFSPDHLILRDILDCMLNLKDLLVFSQRN